MRAAVLGLLACVPLAGLGMVMACKSPHVEPGIIETRAKAALDAEEYRRELADCRAKGKDAGSAEVYEACASAADKKHGVK